MLILDVCKEHAALIMVEYLWLIGRGLEHEIHGLRLDSSLRFFSPSHTHHRQKYIFAYVTMVETIFSPFLNCVFGVKVFFQVFMLK